jgi:hypothetical protein
MVETLAIALKAEPMKLLEKPPGPEADRLSAA